MFSFEKENEEIQKANQEMLNHPFVKALGALLENQKNHGAKVNVSGNGKIMVEGEDLHEKISLLHQAFFQQPSKNIKPSQTSSDNLASINNQEEEIKKDSNGDVLLPPNQQTVAPGGP